MLSKPAFITVYSDISEVQHICLYHLRWSGIWIEGFYFGPMGANERTNERTNKQTEGCIILLKL